MRPGGGYDVLQHAGDVGQRFVAGEQRADDGEQIGGIEAADHRRREVRSGDIESDARAALAKIFARATR